MGSDGGSKWAGSDAAVVAGTGEPESGTGDSDEERSAERSAGCGEEDGAGNGGKPEWMRVSVRSSLRDGMGGWAVVVAVTGAAVVAVGWVLAIIVGSAMDVSGMSGWKDKKGSRDGGSERDDQARRDGFEG